MPYLFDHAESTERERLSAIEAAADPLTIECLEIIGVAEGWCCLEVGAGGGTIAKWLCRRVGPGGRVVATDLQTTFLEAIKAPNLVVRKHDITREELEPCVYDLVFARKVLEHLAEPSAALRRMCAAVRPGGWLMVEDTDLETLLRVSAPHPERFERVYQKFLEALRSAGFQPAFAVRLGDELRALGLQEVQLKGTTWEWTGERDHPGGKVYRMTFQRLRGRMESMGLLTPGEMDQFLADIQSPDFHAISSIHFWAWGRKPGKRGSAPE